MHHTDHWKRWITLLALYLMIGAAVPANGQQAARGRMLLTSQGCLGCHTLDDSKPGRAAPLGARAPELLSPASFAALLWNHDVFAPEAANAESPPMMRTQARDLYAYFDALRAFDPPGDIVSGKAIFDSRCAACHAGREPSASSARDWAPVADLADWAERMGNAAPLMKAALDRVGEPWPKLDVKQASDLVAYLQGLAGGTVRPRAPPDATAGNRSFEQAGCSSCHAFGAAQSAKVDLTRVLRQQATNGGVALAYANHRPEMERAASGRGMQLQPLRSGSLASIVEYMRRQEASGAPGNRIRGEHLFRLEGCLGCHGMPRSGAPELKEPGRRHDAYSIAGGMWRHADRARSVPAHIDPVTQWPELSAREIGDLIAFLNGE